MKRFYNHGNDRIAVVNSTAEEDFDGFQNEIPETDLPSDFGDWCRYESYGLSRGVVAVLSRNGD